MARCRCTHTHTHPLMLFSHNSYSTLSETTASSRFRLKDRKRERKKRRPKRDCSDTVGCCCCNGGGGYEHHFVLIHTWITALLECFIVVRDCCTQMFISIVVSVVSRGRHRRSYPRAYVSIVFLFTQISTYSSSITDSSLSLNILTVSLNMGKSMLMVLG